MELEILLHFGLKNQLKKFNEECYELVESILENNREHIIEEMADVLFLINQFKALYEITDDNLVPVMEYKRDRTLNRIESGYYERKTSI